MTDPPTARLGRLPNLGRLYLYACPGLAGLLDLQRRACRGGGLALDVKAILTPPCIFHE